MTSKQDAPEVRSGAAVDAGDHRWQGRPWLARAVRWSVMVVPFVASVVTAYVLSRALPPAANTAWLVARLAAIAGSATVALKLSDRLMRRFLPLAALLDLTLLFPTRRPRATRSPCATGRRTSSCTSGSSGTPAAAARTTPRRRSTCSTWWRP